MKQYDRLARYYDGVISGKDISAPYVISAIRRFNPRAKTILELGCGTGDVLKGLADRFELTGIDSSAQMLKIAEKKIPGANFIKGDIRHPAVAGRFDAVICMYDTINHVTLLTDWKRIFRNVQNALNDNGLFIFDVNTPYKLKMLERISPLVHEFGRNILIMDIRKTGANVFNWNLRVFENLNGPHFRLLEENISEAVFETGRIMTELEKFFDVLRTEDENGRKAVLKAERVYFICRKKKSK
ncbi:MAG: class I SAM-dependent methyltransferase [Ignavibacteria bacterium]|nr:class I SAM-dependent methyltransferase [Ignavibacteria bacterium]